MIPCTTPIFVCNFRCGARCISDLSYPCFFSQHFTSHTRRQLAYIELNDYNITEDPIFLASYEWLIGYKTVILAIPRWRLFTFCLITIKLDCFDWHVDHHCRGTLFIIASFEHWHQSLLLLSTKITGTSKTIGLCFNAERFNSKYTSNDRKGYIEKDMEKLNITSTVMYRRLKTVWCAAYCRRSCSTRS